MTPHVDKLFRGLQVCCKARPALRELVATLHTFLYDPIQLECERAAGERNVVVKSLTETLNWRLE